MLTMLGAIGTAAVVWMDDRPNQTVWTVRIVATSLAVVLAGGLLAMNYRPDRAPDLLRRRFPKFFDCNGFCFALTCGQRGDACEIQLWFQNRYDHPCRGRVALRPGPGFFLTRPRFAVVMFDVHCPPGAFGVTRIVMPVPAKLQGKRQKFEVGATGHFPEGQGKRLRFRAGLAVGNDSSFGNAFGTMLVAAGAMTGMIVLRKPAHVTLPLPTNVSEELSGQPATTELLWTLDQLTSSA